MWPEGLVVGMTAYTVAGDQENKVCIEQVCCLSLFSIAAFEVIATGLSLSLYKMRDSMDAEACSEKIKEKVKALWTDALFTRYSGAGVRGTSRLANLIPYSKNYFEE